MGKTVGTSARTVLFCLLLSGCARKAVAPGSSGEGLTGDAARALSPLETARLWRQHLKSGSVEGVQSLVAEGLRDDDYRENVDGITRWMKPFVEGKRDFEIIDAKEEGDVAIVIINVFLKRGDRTVDIDPMGLLRQKGVWRVVPRLTILNAYLVEGVPDLGNWYSRRKDELKKQLIR